METSFDTSIEPRAKAHGEARNRRQPAQPASHWRDSRLGRLAGWMLACLQAHEDRVLSLRVYSQRRVDGSGMNDRDSR